MQTKVPAEEKSSSELVYLLHHDDSPFGVSIIADVNNFILFLMQEFEYSLTLRQENTCLSSMYACPFKESSTNLTRLSMSGLDV